MPITPQKIVSTFAQCTQKYTKPIVSGQALSQEQLNILQKIREEWQQLPSVKTYTQASARKLQNLFSRYSTEVITGNIEGKTCKFTKFVGSQQGSNSGFWAYLDGTKELFYVKVPGTQQARSEQLASKLYELGGIKTPEIKLIEVVEGNEWNEKEVAKVASKFLSFERTANRGDAIALREGFGMDCWLANWDALKSDNIVMIGDKACRMDVGGALCYRACGAHKTGAQFGEDVKELTTFFDSYSLSKWYLKDMTRNELLQSLERVTRIKDSEITKLIDELGYKTKIDYTAIKHANGEISFTEKIVRDNAIDNPEFLKETLMARKNYIQEFVKKCRLNPQREGESIEQYVRRIYSQMPVKEYNLPFDKIRMSDHVHSGTTLTLAEWLTPSQKQAYVDSYNAYRFSKISRLSHPGTNNILTTDSMLHAFDRREIETILRDGITSSDLRGGIGTGTNCRTQTPLCADFWDVVQPMPIKEFFSTRTYNHGEKNFLLYTGKGVHMSNADKRPVIVVDKKCVNKKLKDNSFLVMDKNTVFHKDNNMGGHAYPTHRAVPYGVPANAIDRIIIPNGCYTLEELQKIKNIIAQRHLDIKLYSSDGVLL